MANVKTIRQCADLAINGARPAFAEPVHVGRPNVGNRSAFQALTDDMFDRLWLTNDGPYVRELEKRLAELLGVRNCVVTCNGTVALEIVIRSVGLSGEVILPSYTFIATAHALWSQGITPVFADIDPLTHTLDPGAVRRMITSRTTGILPVHLWGKCCDVAALQSVADEHGLEVIYDAAHAFLCGNGSHLIGGFGRAEVFSFHSTKFYNSFEGGAVATDDDDLADRVRLMRNFGFSGYDNVVLEGTNGKMSEICAAMGLVNLDSVDIFVAANRGNYDAYRAAFEAISGLSILEHDAEAPSNFQYVILEVGTGFPVGRDEVVAALHAENILARRYFWPGCHRMKPYKDQFPDIGSALPHTEEVAPRVIVLPTGMSLPKGAIETVRDVCLVLAEQQSGRVWR